MAHAKSLLATIDLVEGWLYPKCRAGAGAASKAQRHFGYNSLNETAEGRRLCRLILSAGMFRIVGWREDDSLAGAYAAVMGSSRSHFSRSDSWIQGVSERTGTFGQVSRH